MMSPCFQALALIAFGGSAFASDRKVAWCAAGDITVTDRATEIRYRVYTPKVVAQFRGGHLAGQWYVRPTSNVGMMPASDAFRSRGDAIRAIRDRGVAGCVRRRMPGVRVIWS